MKCYVQPSSSGNSSSSSSSSIDSSSSSSSVDDVTRYKLLQLYGLLIRNSVGHPDRYMYVSGFEIEYCQLLEWLGGTKGIYKYESILGTSNSTSNSGNSVVSVYESALEVVYKSKGDMGVIRKHSVYTNNNINNINNSNNTVNNTHSDTHSGIYMCDSNTPMNDSILKMYGNSYCRMIGKYICIYMCVYVCVCILSVCMLCMYCIYS